MICFAFAKSIVIKRHRTCQRKSSIILLNFNLSASSSSPCSHRIRDYHIISCSELSKMSHEGGDGQFTYNEGIAVAQIIAFSAPLLAAVYFLYIRQIGWFCIGVFTILRLISASCKLVLINKSSHGLWGALFVCESLGSILIIFLLLELLERM